MRMIDAHCFISIKYSDELDNSVYKPHYINPPEQNNRDIKPS